MKNFEYAAPTVESGVLELLSPESGQTAVLAGGTDLVPLMKQMLVTPARVVNIMNVPSLRGIELDSTALRIGATTTLDELLDAPELEEYPSILQAIRGINDLALQAQGTIGGELLQRPRCWYFRNGHGLLADRGKLIEQGDARYHSIFSRPGEARFVSPSRVAPALVALGAQARLIGPTEEDETLLPVEALFRTPRDERQGEHVLLSNQLLTHFIVPRAEGRGNATYEVRHGAGADFPLTSAAACLELARGVVSRATVVMGQVAPVPWVSQAAASELLGQQVTRDAARRAGEAAVASATPLAANEYKVRLARVAVERAVLLAAGLETGGF